MACGILVPLPGIEHVPPKSLSRVRLFVTPWTIQFVEFSRPEYWSGQPFPSPGDLPTGEALRQIFYRAGPEVPWVFSSRRVDKPKGTSWPAQ